MDTNTNKPDAVVFLDLEETLIDNWDSKNWLAFNAVKVKKFCDELALTHNITLGLMSWAVWNTHDKGVFFDELFSHIETELGQKFGNLIWSMEDWHRQANVAGNSVCAHDKNDFFDVFRKTDVLMMMRKHPFFKNKFVVLIDDMIDHELTVTHNQFKMVLLNIDKM